MENGIISKIRIYPVKSLGYVELEDGEVGIHSLKGDREFAMVDSEGSLLNGKRTSRVNQLKSTFDLKEGLVWLSDKTKDDAPVSFELRVGNTNLDGYLSEFFGINLNLIQNEEGQLMDIPMESSVTIVSEASLRTLQNDIGRYSMENIRQRFRSNIELRGVEAFWEEHLYQEPGVGMRFKLGDVTLVGISPRARCNVPPQNPDDGEMDRNFVREMIQSRNESMPPYSNLEAYGRSSYFLTINVYLPLSEAGKKIRLNDELILLDPVRYMSRT